MIMTAAAAAAARENMTHWRQLRMICTELQIGKYGCIKNAILSLTHSFCEKVFVWWGQVLTTSSISLIP